MNKLFKTTTMLIVAIVLFLTGIINVNATAQQISIGAAPQTGDYIAGVKFLYKKTTDGKYLYCVDMNKLSARNVTANLITNSSVTNGGMYYILKNGFPEKSITGDNDKDYYITQAAVWWYLDETTGSHNLSELFKEKGSDLYGLRARVKALVDEGVRHKNDQVPSASSTSIALGTSSTSMTLSNNYYVSESINATKLVNTDTYSITLTNAPDGTIIAKNGIETAYIGTFNLNRNDSFKIKIPTNKITNTKLKIKVEAKATGNEQYVLNEYEPVNYEMQNVVLLDRESTTATTSLELDIVCSRLSVLKIDANTNMPLSGAVLLLRDANGKELTRWTTTTNAHIIRNLNNGTYTIEEVSAPTGYKKNNNIARITISNERRDIKVNFENVPEKVVVNISKVDQGTKEQIAGAVIEIKDSLGNIIYKFDSKTTSETITDLGYGTYTVQEISAPTGYIKNNNIYTFTVDQAHLSHQITIENAKEVYVPDTDNASSMILLAIGIAIIGYGISYVKKNEEKRFNK